VAKSRTASENVEKRLFPTYKAQKETLNIILPYGADLKSGRQG